MILVFFDSISAPEDCQLYCCCELCHYVSASDLNKYYYSMTVSLLDGEDHYISRREIQRYLYKIMAFTETHSWPLTFYHRPGWWRSPYQWKGNLQIKFWPGLEFVWFFPLNILWFWPPIVCVCVCVGGRRDKLQLPSRCHILNLSISWQGASKIPLFSGSEHSFVIIFYTRKWQVSNQRY